RRSGRTRLFRLVPARQLRVVEGLRATVRTGSCGLLNPNPHTEGFVPLDADHDQQQARLSPISPESAARNPPNSRPRSRMKRRQPGFAEAASPEAASPEA